ncbi:MAG TPA: helix-turn-helix domain-containing protein [Methanobacterium sp.]|nr:helix-turn-helix domain-containing protein [Methanobacterium sp.]HOI39245.1 helix-turn-helix domain-containing protein [Methanobacterium sp.]
MTLSRESMEALKLMGLTDYETKAYVGLTSLISANATEISLTTNVPRSKVYQVLKSLVEKGFVEMSRGKPLKFTVIPPHEVFKKSRDHIRNTMEQAEAELNVVYESQIPKVPAPIWLLHGQEKLVNKELEIISRAEESLFIMGGLMFPKEPDMLKPALNKSMQKGVNIRMLTAPSCRVDDVEVPTKEILGDLPLKIKFFPVPFIKLIVRDKKEMLIAFCKLSGNNALSETTIAIWNQYQEFVDTISGIYDFIWNTDFFNQDFQPFLKG